MSSLAIHSGFGSFTVTGTLVRFSISCFLALVCLEARSRNEYRLFGKTSWRWTLATVLATGAAGVIVSAGILGMRSYVGLAVSAAVPGSLLAGELKRSSLVSKDKDDPGPPSQALKIVTAGIASLVHRLELALEEDRAAWREELFDLEWLDKIQGYEDIEAARRHFHQQISKRVGDNAQRLAELDGVSENIRRRLAVARYSKFASQRELLRQLRQQGLYNEDGYQRLIQEDDLETLRERLQSKAMNNLVAMLTHAYRWRCRLRSFQPPTDGSSGSQRALDLLAD